MIKDATSVLTDKLSRLTRLGPEERQALADLRCRIEQVPARRMLVREGDEPANCCVLLSGYACRHKCTGEGGRQIVSFHLPGDIVDLQILMLPRADHNVEAISDAKVGWIPARDLKHLLSTHPVIAQALWRDTLLDAAIFREWILNVGRRSARSRIAHLLCEFATRRQAAGLGSPECFELPMTQEVIADATGLTVVHVNRTLGALTEDGVISRKGREYRIADWSQMQQVADFDAFYLYPQLESEIES